MKYPSQEQHAYRTTDSYRPAPPEVDISSRSNNNVHSQAEDSRQFFIHPREIPASLKRDSFRNPPDYVRKSHILDSYDKSLRSISII